MFSGTSLLTSGDLREGATNRFPQADTRLVDEEDIIAGLHRLVEGKGVDLEVLSAHGYSGNPQRRYGSVTTDFIEYDSAPLLVVQDLRREDIAPCMARALEVAIFARESQATRLHFNTMTRS